MIITCPSCDAKFKIPDGSVGEEGRRVRCGKCSNMWTAMPDGSAAKPEVKEQKPAISEAPDIDEVLAKTSPKPSKPLKKSKKKTASKDVNLEAIGDYKPPAKRRSKLKRWSMGLSYVALTIIIALLWTVLEKPDWWGFEATSGFSFEQIDIKPMEKIGGDRFSSNPTFIISGVVRNVSDKPQHLPLVRVSLRDDQEEVIYSKSYTLHDQAIPPGESINFVLENLEQAENRHTHFVVEMGNRLELALRSVDVSDEH